MNKLRRTILTAGTLGVFSTLSGCLTPKLFEPNSYIETISAVLISQDKKSLVIISDNYHYIFDVPEIIAATLQSNFHKSVRAWFGTFNVDPAGKIEGEFEMYLINGAAQEDQKAALLAGFKQTGVNYINYRTKLYGVRYSSNGIMPTASAQKLNQEYKILVRAEKSSKQKAANSLLTPITVAADGLLLIAAIPLVAVFVGTLAVVCRNPGC